MNTKQTRKNKINYLSEYPFISRGYKITKKVNLQKQKQFRVPLPPKSNVPALTEEVLRWTLACIPLYTYIHQLS
jgi:hypothetical protein